MDNNSDLTFITNEDYTLLDRFEKLVPKYTKKFDCLVGYFYMSGFYKMWPNLEDLEKIRILVGIGVDKNIANFNLFSQEKTTKEAKEDLDNRIKNEIYRSEDSEEIEIGIKKFVEWIQSGKLEIKAYKKHPIHSKLYIMTFDEDNSPDVGRVITGSSNLTQAGLISNLEFNVELKNSSDYNFALNSFEKLWLDAIDVGEVYIDTVLNKTHLSDKITPYELYLKFLYEYFEEDLSIYNEKDDIPKDIMDLDYQKQAVINAKKILEEYGGVFISDVVGLGKTYMSARLASKYKYKNILVIAPPALIDENNPGSWPNAFYKFKVPGKFRSVGTLDKIIEEGFDDYDLIFIDESHRFRNEMSQSYEKLAEICRGKMVVLVSATPFNNTPLDLLSQIKLFQNPKNSTIPGVKDLERFFNKLNQELKKIDRKKEYNLYIETTKRISKEIRQKVLKYIMVRRTRSEVKKYFGKDLEKQKLSFPEVAKPVSLYYEFDEYEDNLFFETLQFIKDFKYSRYSPLMYSKEEKYKDPRNIQSQKNMKTFMKMLLIKRFESSIFAFKRTLNRFINSYEAVIREYKKGFVYISKNSNDKFLEFLIEGDDEKIQEMIDLDRADKYEAKNFKTSFLDDLQEDLDSLNILYKKWEKIEKDIKLETFIKKIKEDEILKKNKLIIFTESKETSQYISERIREELKEEVLNFTGDSSNAGRNLVIKNFDSNIGDENGYRILITTDILAEGVNLRQSNVVLNYDIPWNPTRVMQRVGRINRLDTKFKKIYTYNFFPTTQSNTELGLEEAAKSKIEAFINLLGNDSQLLTDEENVTSHTLFNTLNSKEFLEGEGDGEDQNSELKYLTIIKDIRKNEVDLFEKIKKLPKKSRTFRKYEVENNSLLTYFKKGKLDKFIISNGTSSKELDFFDTAKILECKKDEVLLSFDSIFYELLKLNKKEFDVVSNENFIDDDGKIRNFGNINKFIKILKALNNYSGFTDIQTEYINKLLEVSEAGLLPKQTVKKVIQKINNESNALNILEIIRDTIPENFLNDSYSNKNIDSKLETEVILSELLINRII